ncbi:hypothetical protein QT971_18510 [Microcoleus sp. herbarium19]|uniref:hypothetical protein n=1 Tax=Microcoleus sp. herbarium13 TaxID=3055438 RepID=UPI002FD488F1
MCKICAIAQKVHQKRQPNSQLLDTSQFSRFIDLKQLSLIPEFTSAKSLKSH